MGIAGVEPRQVPSFIKEHKSANLSLKNLLHFCMEDSKNPIASH
jgi:hypothetical protein